MALNNPGGGHGSNSSGLGQWINKWINNALVGLIVGSAVTVGTTAWTVNSTVESAQDTIFKQLEADEKQRIKDIKRPAYTNVYLSAQTLSTVMNERAEASCGTGKDSHWARDQEPCKATSITALRELKSDLDDALQQASLVPSPDATEHLGAIRQAFASIELQPTPFPQKRAADITTAMTGLQQAITCTASPDEDVVKGPCA